MDNENSLPITIERLSSINDSATKRLSSFSKFFSWLRLLDFKNVRNRKQTYAANDSHNEAEPLIGSTNSKQPRDKNQQADDKNSQNEPERLIGYFELFRFSDRIDLLLMFAGICCTLLYSIAYNVRLVIFARIAASFVVDLFAKQCVVGQHNTLGISSDNIGCQLYVNTDVFDQRDK
ncbi:unnamed protein product [Rotaria magnacalcarata]|uniref:Uncharacterized protein n=1 Tax=Rotaria magnacalcarata TaxID=392030 RepID=A0A816YX52_9BILA|nr:unnamed protein product [Rotaria magnacalcarata]